MCKARVRSCRLTVDVVVLHGNQPHEAPSGRQIVPKATCNHLSSQSPTSIILSIEEETGLREDIVRNAETYTTTVLECPIVDHFKNQLTRLLKIYHETDIFQMAVDHGREDSTSKVKAPRAKLGELKQRAEEHVGRL